MLVLGTRNRKKIEELAALFAGLEIELTSLDRWPEVPEVVEDGATFEANAAKKATEVSQSIHYWVLAEDSGLVVPSLGGRPGVHSARFAGNHGDDAANNARLLSELAPFEGKKREAYYVCVLALADSGGRIKATAEGRCHGVIAPKLRGGGGFGYDPLFLIPEYHRTFGELSARVKHALSHRARAVARLIPLLRPHLGSLIG
jgi:XTP/dITP diphosphohydrolase